MRTSTGPHSRSPAGSGGGRTRSHGQGGDPPQHDAVAPLPPQGVDPDRWGEGREAVEEGGESVLNVEAKSVSGEMLFDIELGQPLELRTVLDLEMVVPGPVEAGAPGKMPMKTLSVQKLLKVEDLPAKAAKPSGTTEKKSTAPSGNPKPSASSRGETLTPEEKKARRKARREKRKAAKP